MSLMSGCTEFDVIDPYRKGHGLDVPAALIQHFLESDLVNRLPDLGKVEFKRIRCKNNEIYWKNLFALIMSETTAEQLKDGESRVVLESVVGSALNVLNEDECIVISYTNQPSPRGIAKHTPVCVVGIGIRDDVNKKRTITSALAKWAMLMFRFKESSVPGVIAAYDPKQLGGSKNVQRERNKTIRVAQDFTPFPIFRLRGDGSFSGEEFREDHLMKALSEGMTVTVELDGTIGYGSAFLQEAFGGLVHELGLSDTQLKSRLKLKTENQLLEEEVLDYMFDERREATLRQAS